MVKKFIILYLVLGGLLLLAKDNTIEVGSINKYHYVDMGTLNSLLRKCYVANQDSIKSQFSTGYLENKDGDVFSILDDKCSKFKEYAVVASQIVKSIDYLTLEKQREFMLDMTTYVYRIFKNLSIGR